jgi:hypothetical protein
MRRRLTEGRGIFFFLEGSLGFVGSEFEFCSREGSYEGGAPVCWGFWAWGPRFLTVSWS